LDFLIRVVPCGDTAKENNADDFYRWHQNASAFISRPLQSCQCWYGQG
jgi:hypothetical protein